MAPVAPSPHRFVSAEQRKASLTKEPKVPSAPGQRTTPREIGDHVAPQHLPPPAQFASTPRFSIGKAVSRDPPERSRSPVKPAAIYSLRATARGVDDVVDASPEDNNEDEEMLDNAQGYVLPTTEDELGTGSEWTKHLPYSPKKRRLYDSLGAEPLLHAALSSPARPSFKHPQTKASQLPKPAPRFAPPQNAQNASIDEELSQHRPTFLRSTVATHAPEEPLPEAFSPHRRGQKFIPGGMAATVQQWVIETGQAAVQSRRGQAHLRGEDFVAKVKIVDVKGDGPLTGTAHIASGEAVNVLLTQTAGPLSSSTADVGEGVVIGIRAPTWHVNVDGRVWKVGVDWKVLS